jgi:hypothetical protein
MNIWGWIAIGIVVLALILLAIVALGTFRRLRSLQRAQSDPELIQDVTALQSRIAGLSEELAEVQSRVATAQERAMALKPSREPENA